MADSFSFDFKDKISRNAARAETLELIFTQYREDDIKEGQINRTPQ